MVYTWIYTKYNKINLLLHTRFILEGTEGSDENVACSSMLGGHYDKATVPCGGKYYPHQGIFLPAVGVVLEGRYRHWGEGSDATSKVLQALLELVPRDEHSATDREVKREEIHRSTLDPKEGRSLAFGNMGICTFSSIYQYATPTIKTMSFTCRALCPFGNGRLH